MKKIAILIIVLLGVSITMLAQVIEPPTDMWQAIANFKYFIGSFSGAYALLFFLVPTVLGLVNAQSKFLKYLITIVIITGVSLAANVLKFGFMYQYEWWAVLIGGLLLFMVQVGIFAIPFAKEIQEQIYDKWNPVKE